MSQLHGASVNANIIYRFLISGTKSLLVRSAGCIFPNEGLIIVEGLRLFHFRAFGDIQREIATHSLVFCLLAIGVQGALLYYSTQTWVEGDGPRH